MSKSQAIMTYVQIFNPGDKYLQPILRANRVVRTLRIQKYETKKGPELTL